MATHTSGRDAAERPRARAPPCGASLQSPVQPLSRGVRQDVAQAYGRMSTFHAIRQSSTSFDWFSATCAGTPDTGASERDGPETVCSYLRVIGQVAVTNCGRILDRDEKVAKNIFWRGQRLRGVPALAGAMNRE